MSEQTHPVDVPPERLLARYQREVIRLTVDGIAKDAHIDECHAVIAAQQEVLSRVTAGAEAPP